MNKREDITIYILSHKEVEYGIWDNELYTPIQMGNRESYTAVRDNTGDNVSEWNEIYAENTGIYWIWKNCHSKYKGQCQYRRRLEFPVDTNFDDIFSNYDIITCSPLKLQVTIADQYRKLHCPKDFEIIEGILKRKEPQFAFSFDQVFNGNDVFLFYSNGFIMPAEKYDAYCEWLFSIIDEYKRIKGWNTVQDAKDDIDSEIFDGSRRNYKGTIYQRQVFGFLSERLFTYYVFTRMNKILTMPYKLMEDTGI